MKLGYRRLRRALLAATVIGLAAVGLQLTSIAGASSVPPSALSGQATLDAAYASVSVQRGERELCTGVLITDEWVLTSSYCAAGGPDQIAYFDVSAGSTPNADRTVAAVYRAPLGADLALLKLTSPVTQQDNAGNPHPVRSPALTQTRPSFGTNGVAYGFGGPCQAAGTCPPYWTPTLGRDGSRIAGYGADGRVGEFLIVAPAAVVVAGQVASISVAAGTLHPGDAGQPLVIDGNLVGISSGTVGDKFAYSDLTAPGHLAWIATTMRFS